MPYSVDYSALMPAKVTTVFAGRRCSGTPDVATPRVYKKTININAVAFTDPDVPTAPALLGQPDELVIRSTALALFNAGGSTPTNQTALDNLATQIAQDTYDYLSQRFMPVYNGVVNPAPSSLIDYFEIFHDDDSIDTAIVSTPWNPTVIELQHNDGTNNATCVDGGGVVVEKYPYIEIFTSGTTLSGGSTTFGSLYISLESGRLASVQGASYVDPCHCAGGGGPQTCIRIDGCNSAGVTFFPLSGVSVTLKQGGTTIDSWTTDATGKHCLTSLPNGNYDIIINSAPTGYATGTFTRFLTQGFTTDVILSPDSTHVCCPNCLNPNPKTLYATDSNGVHTLTYSGSGWVSSLIPVSVPVAYLSPGCVTTGPGTVYYQYTLTCNSGNNWSLAELFRVMTTSGLGFSTPNVYPTDSCTYFNPSCTLNVAVGNSQHLSPCSPVNLTFTLSSTATQFSSSAGCASPGTWAASPPIPVPVSGSVTITE